MINMGVEGRSFRLPQRPDKRWGLVLDTGRDPAMAPVPPEEQIPIRRDGIYLEARTLIVLEGR